MIERIRWPEEPRFLEDELPSPFLRGEHERPLRITFHTQTLDGLPPEETEALEAVSQLSHLAEIEALQTEPGVFPHLEIGAESDDGDYIPVTVEYDEDRGTESGIHYPRQWPYHAASIIGQSDRNHPDVQAMLRDLIVAQAHRALRQDVLITTSPWLLEHRAHPIVSESNPRSPTEAAQIVGLFLRSRSSDYYTIWASERGGQRRFGRGLFYWVLVRHRLPNMWRYHSACVAAERVRGDDIAHLGGSALRRCVRALQARDAIGQQFYVPQSNDTADDMMYHFDYLTLLLSGALDAQARVAHRAYSINSPGERQASFRRDDFRRALRQHDAQGLCDLVSGQRSQAILTLIYEPRNTIHGSSLPTVAYHNGIEPELSLVKVPTEYEDALLEAAERCDSAERWGLTREYALMFEPYTYSITLVQESFRLIDAIATATDITGLFPDGHTIPQLMGEPPDDQVFGEHIRRRLAVLG